VKWGTTFSGFFFSHCAVYGKAVSSHLVFSLFIDSVVDKVAASHLGCHVKHICFNILMYADDIIVIRFIGKRTKYHLDKIPPGQNPPRTESPLLKDTRRTKSPPPR